MNAPEVSEEPHRVHPTLGFCWRCGLSQDAIDGLRLRICSRTLELRERRDADDRARPAHETNSDIDW